MSKLINDLITEFHSLDEIEDSFGFYIMWIQLDDEGEITSSDSLKPVSHIEIDKEDQACLFHFTENGEAMNIAEAIEVINSENSEYALFSAEETTLDDEHVRIDNPIIGFGENVEQRCFFIVCQDYKNDDVLH